MAIPPPNLIVKDDPDAEICYHCNQQFQLGEHPGIPYLKGNTRRWVCRECEMEELRRKRGLTRVQMFPRITPIRRPRIPVTGPLTAEQWARLSGENNPEMPELERVSDVTGNYNIAIGYTSIDAITTGN
jgi:hypothetical protein